MVFGFLQRQQNADRDFLTAAGIPIAFDKMRKDCPAAAYIFARTMFNARPLLSGGVSDVSRRQQLDKAIAETRPHVKADAGVSLLALQVLRQAADATDAAARSAYFNACESIGEHGRRYRDLDEMDYEIPLDEDDEELVRSMGGESIGHCIDDLEDNMKDASAEEINEAADTILATFEIRQEVRDGSLAVHIRFLKELMALRW